MYYITITEKMSKLREALEGVVMLPDCLLNKKQANRYLLSEAYSWLRESIRYHKARNAKRVELGQKPSILKINARKRKIKELKRIRNEFPSLFTKAKRFKR